MFALLRHWLVTTTHVRGVDAGVHQLLQDLKQSHIFIHLTITLGVDVNTAVLIDTLHVGERVCGNVCSVREVQHSA